MSDPIRRFHIVVTDSKGKTCQITDTYLVGRFRELEHATERAVEQWEIQTGQDVVSITLESHGKVAS